MKIVNLVSGNIILISQAAEILFKAFPHSWDSLESAVDEVHECLSDDKITRAAIDDCGKVLGWIGGRSMYGGNVWELHPLIVHSEYQGQGIGRALVTDFEEQVRDRGAITVWLGTDDETGSTSLSGVDVYPDVFDHITQIRNLKRHPFEFYQKLGYTIVGICPDANGFGKPDIYMAKRVAGQR